MAAAAGPAAAGLLARLQRAQLDLAVASHRLHAPQHAELGRRRAVCHDLRTKLWRVPGVLEALGMPAETVERVRAMPEPDVFKVQARVAPTGGWAWATPTYDDPRRGALVPGLALQVMEHHGNWLLVRAENGWLGWTDSRYLYPTAV